MTVKQLIIEVQLQVQRMGSFKRDSTFEQLILWRLNTAQDRLIKSWLKPDPDNPNKFQIDQKANTDIQRILTPNVACQTIVDKDDRIYCYLPQNFRYLVNDRSRILEDCKTEFATAIETTTYPVTVTAIKFVSSTLTTPNYYKEIVITITKNSLSDVKTLTNNGTLSKEEKFEFIDYVIFAGKQMGYNIYWETFHTVYEPDSFIFVPNDLKVAASMTLKVDGVLLTSISISIGNHTLYKTIASTVTSLAVNRGIRSDFIYDASLQNHYDKPQPDSPISQLADGKIYIHASKRFLVSEVLLDYIRSPRRISLYLNQTCELDESTHEEVCSIATEMILGNIEAPNYPAKIQENIHRLEKT